MSQSRPNIFDLEIRRPELLYKAVVEVDERVVLDKDGEGGWEPSLPDTAGESETAKGNESGVGEKAFPAAECAVLEGLTGEGVRVVKELDLSVVRSSLQTVLDQGITSLAVILLHR